MTRRIVRTSLQLGFLVFLLVFLVYFLDTQYRVLPTAIHTHLPSHHPGLVVTDITVKTCSFSSCKLDPTLWHRIEKDLLLKSGWITKSYMHVKRKKEEELTPDDKVIMDLKVGRLDPGKLEADGGESSEGVWEKRDAGIWIKRSAKRHDFESKKVVTAVDILFGADAVEPRPGWEIRDQALLLSYPRDAPEARVSIRRGVPKKMEMPVPRVRKDGKFKIMQLADLHLSTGLGACRDAVPPSPNGKCEADPRTLEFVTRLLDQEKPDFVVLSGDQVNGETAPDAQSAIFKFVDILASRKIPYAAIYGNHDDEGNLNRNSATELLQTLPYSMTQPGPNTIPGVGNYYIRVLAHTGHHAALTMFFLDTHSYSPDDKKYHGYDWIKPEQIKWFKDTAKSLQADNKKYSHVHLDMAFIHIPLPEYRLGGQMWGDRKEPPTAPGYNSGFRDALVEMGVPVVSCGHDHANDYCLLNEGAPGPSSQSLKRDERPKGDVNHRDEEDTGSTKKMNSHPAAADKEDAGELSAPVAAHPDHKAPKNDKIWLCYGGGAGFGGYGGWGGYIRRVRFFELDANEAKIRTWKRLEHGDIHKRIDEQTIVDAGRVLSN